MTDQAASMSVADFDYELPPELIAQTPLPERDASRLMVVDRATGTIEHDSIRALPRWLRPGDLLVVNNTKVLPARIHATKVETGGKVELLLLHRDPSGVWLCLGRPAKGLRPGTRLRVEAKDGGEVLIDVVSKGEEGEVGVRFLDSADQNLDRIGMVPLPPYIRTPIDSGDRYQTVYARVPGSSAAPTAGLHITDRLRQELTERGVSWAEVTLHIGLDTFRPVTVEHISEHKIHREWCSLPPETARAILETKQGGGRVVAVGTTSARTLETWGLRSADAPERGFEGWSDLFITPGFEWRVVDALLTNFHLPRSTLLMMISSFAGLETVRRAYAEAIARRYRFFSFGDAMLIV